jgi:hypothetical protein
MAGTVEWSQLAAIVGFVVTGGIIVAGVVVWLWTKLSSTEHDTQQNIDALRSSLHNLRVEIAEKYVPNSELSKVESRIENSLVAMAEKVERGFERLADQITRLSTKQ